MSFCATRIFVVHAKLIMKALRLNWDQSLSADFNVDVSDQIVKINHLHDFLIFIFFFHFLASVRRRLWKQ